MSYYLCQIHLQSHPFSHVHHHYLHSCPLPHFTKVFAYHTPMISKIASHQILHVLKHKIYRQLRHDIYIHLRRFIIEVLLPIMIVGILSIKVIP